MGVNSRVKGNKAQRSAASVLTKWTKKKFASTPRSGGLRWGSMSSVIGDVVCTKEGHYFPFAVEVKSYNTINFEHSLYLPEPDIGKFWSQCVRDSKTAKKLPLLMMRYNRMPKDFFFVGLALDDYRALSLEPLPNKRLIIEHYNLILVPSTELVKTNYKGVRKEAKKRIQKIYNAKKKVQKKT